MRRTAKFIVALIAGLGAVTYLGSAIVRDATRGWFEKDLVLRAELAGSGARQALISHWGHSRELQSLLDEITRARGILAAAACDKQARLVAKTAEYPEQLACTMRRAPAGALEPDHEASIVSAVVELPAGDRHVTSMGLGEPGETLGFLILVQDLSFVARRESSTDRFMLLAFGVLALAAAGVTAVAARLAFRGWSAELRQLLNGGPQRPEFSPILRDVRELVDRLVREKDLDGGAAWTPERLKRTLRRRLHGQKVLIVANREPHIHEYRDGRVVVLHPASGLVTALEPVLRACSGVWIAHGSGAADRDTVDRHSRLQIPEDEPSYVLRRIWLTREQEQGYYYGFANEGLWPLCHLAHVRPVFRSADWEYYEQVNRAFADAVCDEAEVDDPIVLVQDYHFALAPKLIRERLPRATILMFCHVPWPSAERLAICPYADALLQGMLGASILGFQTQSHCNNFLGCIDALVEARIDREQHAVVQQGRGTLVRAYPIGIEWPSRWARAAPPVSECRAQVRRELGLSADAWLGVGVDRLDYTKGIEERLLAVERAFERFPELHGRFTFVQIAAPSRVQIDRYREFGERVEAITQRINARFGEARYRPIALLRAHHEPAAVYRFYRAADFCSVNSLHDGMNLVAKEFVAARDDERGVLVLSQFTGAAAELTEALIVNPYDLVQSSQALVAALRMPAEEQRYRMRAMRALVSEFNVFRWAGRMLVDASRLRSRDRINHRLASRVPAKSTRPKAVHTLSNPVRARPAAAGAIDEDGSPLN